VDGDDNYERCNDMDVKERGGIFEGNYPVFAFKKCRAAFYFTRII